MLGDILIIMASLYISFLLRFDFVLSSGYKHLILNVLPLFLIVKLLSFSIFRMYKITWRYVSIDDLFNIVCAVVVSNSVLMAMILFPAPHVLHLAAPIFTITFPRGIFLTDGIISVLLLSTLRISKRFFYEVIGKKRFSSDGKRTVIVGAGNTGELILRDMVKQRFSDFCPVALLDDDMAKVGAYMHGVKVFGTTNELKKAVARYNAEAVIIAIPSLNHKSLRNIYNAAKESKVAAIKIVPRIYDFHKPDINLRSLEEISVEDLIGRQAVSIDYQEIEQFLDDKTVLVTGAGGSIGSEIVRQVCAFYPRKIILFDIDETALHTMQLGMKRHFPNLTERAYFIAGDIKDESRVREVMAAFYPEIVFHAAAYKHVPMMENNPKEAVKVNMFGTYTVARAAINAGVKKFIMISTDKAVLPTSIMGATKRMAENICKAFNTQGKTAFVSVRFGNVLGSRGSVLPLFLEQLRYGGPLTVTHKEMQRYFMTIPEAVSLVLQASVTGKGGEVLVLDMGEPVKILELAEELIRIHGLEPYKDIDIKFIGLRPGEKLFEEILTAEEGTSASKHEKIFISKNTSTESVEGVERILDVFKVFLDGSQFDNGHAVKEMLRKYVPHYHEKN